jgi:phage/plasmid-like protein (TIGR03299 family)
VRKTPITTVDGGVEIDNRWATVYTNPVTNATQYLGVVGSHYEPIQNEAHVDLLDAIVDESGAHFETAGSLRKGRETFVSMKIPATMNVGGVDPVDLYLVALNSHDGTSSFRFLITPVRVVCANTQAAALKSAKSSFSIRHVRGAQGHVQEAREALDLTFRYLDAFEIEAEKMIKKSITDAAFAKITAQLFDAGNATTARAKTTLDQHLGGVMSLWNGDGLTMQDVKGTKWGAYQAITEYADHFMSVRGNSAETRALRSATSTSMQALKQSAFLLLNK